MNMTNTKHVRGKLNVKDLHTNTHDTARPLRKCVCSCVCVSLTHSHWVITGKALPVITIE